MKTLVKITTVLVVAFFFSFTTFANQFVLNEEAYIDDIPFDTELIAEKALFEMAMSEKFYMEEEQYVDDIPFNTDSIYRDCICKKAMAEEFEMEEEEYIDDIPFDTYEIAFNCYRKLESLVVYSKLGN